MTANPSIGVDQRVALKVSANRLAAEFSTIYNAATQARFLRSSYEQFAATATTGQFLPLQAERFARQRLQALARVDGRVGRQTSRAVLVRAQH